MLSEERIREITDDGHCLDSEKIDLAYEVRRLRYHAGRSRAPAEPIVNTQSPAFMCIYCDDPTPHDACDKAISLQPPHVKIVVASRSREGLAREVQRLRGRVETVTEVLRAWCIWDTNHGGNGPHDIPADLRNLAHAALQEANDAEEAKP